ncbi:uncharacterized protein [Rutidosis leptorrhynchoides]|uniref:uncharacterized protein n=1 Tax=Rutidosis leptorrhynchoides TaxID=125765 RepID=UPI003A9A4573
MAEIPRNMTLEEAHNLRRDRAIEALQHQMEKMFNLLEDGVPRRNRTRSENGYTTIVFSSTESEDGSSNHKDNFEWVPTMDRIMEVKGYDDKKGLKVAVIRLKKYASMWYDNLKKERQYEGKKTIKTWSKLKECMQKRFIPQAYKQDLYIQMNTLKLGSMNVVDYIREFEQLKIRANVKEAEEHTIARLIGGLNASIIDQVKMQPLWTFDSACKLAIQVEKKAKKKNNFKSYSKPAMLPMKGQLSMLPKHNMAASKAIKGKEQIEDLEGGFETELAYDESDSEEFVAADIGEFLMNRRDEITCDVIPMDACHLLLGRPWLFDKYVYHNGHQNTYSLYVNGKKITLTSLKPSEIPRADPTAKNDKTLFMNQAEVDTNLKGTTGAYLLLLVEIDELNQHDEVPARVKPLLSEFSDGFLSELPAGLPPISGIEHQIDLVHRFVLPNKLAYRCSPHEAK